MKQQNAGSWVKIVIVAGFVISLSSAGYLIVSSKMKTQAIKTGGDLTLTTTDHKTFKLIPEECHYQKTNDLNLITLNSHNSFDLEAEYSSGSDGIASLNVKNPSDQRVTSFIKAECQEFKDSFTEVNHVGSIEVNCLKDGLTLSGKMYFADCPAK